MLDAGWCDGAVLNAANVSPQYGDVVSTRLCRAFGGGAYILIPVGSAVPVGDIWRRYALRVLLLLFLVGVAVVKERWGVSSSHLCLDSSMIVRCISDANETIWARNMVEIVRLRD